MNQIMKIINHVQQIIFLVHNGIITNHKEIKHKYKFNNVELDSIVILDLMESKSNDKNYLEKFISCIKELSGEITICLYSTAEKKFIFLYKYRIFIFSC